MKDKYIIIVGDDPRLKTGFAKIVDKLVDTVKLTNCTPLVLGFKKYQGLVSYDKCQLLSIAIETPDDLLGTKLLVKTCKNKDVIAVISIGDPWDIRGVAEAKRQVAFYWIGYTPVESIPYPRYILIGTRSPLQYLDAGKILSNIDQIITYSKFGVDAVTKMMLEEYATSDPSYKLKTPISHIYLGVDSSLFRQFDKVKSREVLQGISRDDILFMCNKANSPRVGYDLLLTAWEKFMVKIQKRRPDLANRVKLYLHTNLDTPGTAIPALIKLKGLSKSVLLHKELSFGHGVPDEAMVLIYNATDIFVTAAKGEGFGLPVLEAMACGVPAIIPNYACPVEFASNSSIVVPIAEYYNPDFSYTNFALIDTDKFADAMYNLATDKKQRIALGQQGVIESRQYSWHVFTDEWSKILNMVIQNHVPKKKEVFTDTTVNKSKKIKAVII